jgi:hypothetical protein
VMINMAMICDCIKQFRMDATRTNPHKRHSLCYLLHNRLSFRRIQAPWQNGTTERWVGSCRCELLDYITPVNESHLRRLPRTGFTMPCRNTLRIDARLSVDLLKTQR